MKDVLMFTDDTTEDSVATDISKELARRGYTVHMNDSRLIGTYLGGRKDFGCVVYVGADGESARKINFYGDIPKIRTNPGSETGGIPSAVFIADMMAGGFL